MKIVQSFWTKPFLETNSTLVDGRLNGGWPHRIVNYYSWALSCLQLRKYYDSVELVTDEIGKEILIDHLKLPYTNTVVALNDIDHYDSGLWALGKLYTYSLQKDHFLHVDGDIFIWNAFEKEIFEARLAVQNLESNQQDEYTEMWKRFLVMPDYFDNIDKLENVPGVSAGIIGGRDIEFLQEYVREAFSFLEKNMEVITGSLLDMHAGRVNIICEQVLFYSLAKSRDRDITCLFSETDILNLGFFHAAPQNKNYVHCFGQYKMRRLSYSTLEWKLKSEYPEYYHRVKDLVYSCEI